MDIHSYPDSIVYPQQMHRKYTCQLSAQLGMSAQIKSSLIGSDSVCV